MGTRKVQDATNTAGDDDAKDRRLRFILGTEAGMVTSIVKSVQDILEKAATTSQGGRRVEAEVIFPVSSEAVMSTEDSDESTLSVVPGVAGGEGCSTAGGCATCPFMKMNDLDDEMRQGDDNSSSSERRLREHLPPTKLQGKFIDGIDAIELGTEAILFMRHFMLNKSMPKKLVDKVTTFTK